MVRVRNQPFLMFRNSNHSNEPHPQQTKWLPRVVQFTLHLRILTIVFILHSFVACLIVITLCYTPRRQCRRCISTDHLCFQNSQDHQQCPSLGAMLRPQSLTTFVTSKIFLITIPPCMIAQNSDNI